MRHFGSISQSFYNAAQSRPFEDIGPSAEIGLMTLVIALIAIFYLLARSRTPCAIPLEPPLIRSWIPYFGHEPAFIRDQRGFFEWANKKSDSLPFTMYMSGTKFYIFARPDDVSAIFRRSSTIDENRDNQLVFRTRILKFGREDALRIADLKAEEGKVHHSFLLGQEELERNVVRFVEELDAQMEKLEDRVKDIGGESGLMVESAFSFVGKIMIDTTSATVYGRRAFEGYEVLFEDLRAWLSDKFLLRTLGLPDWFCANAARARERIKNRLRDVVNGIGDEKEMTSSPVSGYVKSRVEVMEKLGVSREGVVTNELVTILGANLNSIPMAYLTLLHLLADRKLLATICEELTTIDWLRMTVNHRAAALPDSLPRLQALVREVMRYHSTSLSAREVNAPTTLTLKPASSSTSAEPRIYTLRPPSVVLMPSSLLHHNPTIHNSPETFDPGRFLSPEFPGGKGTLVSAAALRPFGGGGSYCPGRKFAERQILGLVAELILRFEFKVVDEKGVEADGWEIPMNADFDFVTRCKNVRLVAKKRQQK